MTDLLLITESERLRTIFSRLDDGSSFRLRHANSLEKAAEQLEADEPGFVFVQASFGSPADILLKYQQNASGQTRTRFVLLESAQETSGEVRLHYQGFLDISQDDETLLENIRALIASPSTASDTPGHLVSAPSSTPAIVSQREAGAFRTFAGLQEEKEAAGESSLWSKRGAFMLWLIPVVIAIIIVPMLQKKRPKSEPAEDRSAVLSATASIPTPVPQQKKPAVMPSVQAPTAAAETKRPRVSAAVPATPAQNPTAEPDPRLSDKAILAAIAENQDRNKAESVKRASARPVVLPAFIPRSGQDKSYGELNPGWERYKGLTTEFKVFREGGAIKAIQIIDRGSKGIAESFMKGVLSQVSTTPAFTLEVTEKKDKVQILRGRVGEDLKAVFYRDEQSGRLQGFVLTWP